MNLFVLHMGSTFDAVENMTVTELHQEATATPTVRVFDNLELAKCVAEEELCLMGKWTDNDGIHTMEDEESGNTACIVPVVLNQ